MDSFKHAAKVWCKMAPPKVELLVWFLVLGKLNTKDKLISLNIIPTSEGNCVNCGEHVESIGHLFSHAPTLGNYYASASPGGKWNG